jgi:uncharacterized protein with GYD domain
MGKYLMASDYVGAGITGLIKEGGSRRRSVIADLFDSMGGRLEVFYYAFAERNVYLIGELPDDATAMAMALKINSSGLATCRVTVLASPEDMDIAVKKTGRYRAPGVDLEQAGLATWDNEGGHPSANEGPDTGRQS